MKLVGERRALAAIVFAFFFLNFVLNAVLGPAPLAKLFYALAGCYGLAFFAVVAGYFWARWYAMGLGLFGVILGVFGIWQGGRDTEFGVLLMFGLHLMATLSMWGEAMSSAYDGQMAWRERFHMDEYAVRRLGNSVIRAGVSLPMVLAYAFVPKQSAVAIVALVLTGVGFHALTRMKTWGVLALGAAGTMMFAMGIDHLQLQPAVAGGLLLSAAAPFALPMLRFARAV